MVTRAAYIAHHNRVGNGPPPHGLTHLAEAMEMIRCGDIWTCGLMRNFVRIQEREKLRFPYLNPHAGPSRHAPDRLGKLLTPDGDTGESAKKRQLKQEAAYQEDYRRACTGFDEWVGQVYGLATGDAKARLQSVKASRLASVWQRKQTELFRHKRDTLLPPPFARDGPGVAARERSVVSASAREAATVRAALRSRGPESGREYLLTEAIPAMQRRIEDARHAMQVAKAKGLVKLVAVRCGQLELARLEDTSNQIDAFCVLLGQTHVELATHPDLLAPLKETIREVKKMDVRLCALIEQFKVALDPRERSDVGRMMADRKAARKHAREMDACGVVLEAMQGLVAQPEEAAVTTAEGLKRAMSVVDKVPTEANCLVGREELLLDGNEARSSGDQAWKQAGLDVREQL